MARKQYSPKLKFQVVLSVKDPCGRSTDGGEDPGADCQAVWRAPKFRRFVEENLPGERRRALHRGEDGTPQAKYPLCSLFAYTTDAKRDEAERLKEQVPGGMYYLRLIGVLDKGVWCFNETSNVMEHRDVAKEDISVEYMRLLLDRIEEAADSRGGYRLQDWLA